MATVPPDPSIPDPFARRPRPEAPARAGAAGAHAAPLVAGALLVVAAYGLLLLDRDALFPLIDEDGWVESAGALALAVAAGMFAAAWMGSRPPVGSRPFLPRLSLLVLALLFALGAGEETSWGQRLLDLDPPEALLAANAQGESNLHNLEGVDGSVDDLFTAFIWLFAIALPLAAARRPRVRARAARLVPVLPVWVALLVLANEVAFRVVWWGMPREWYAGLHPFSQATHEIRETIVSILFALGAAAVARQVAAERRPSGERPGPPGPAVAGP